jgi:hypothetical protein
MGWRRVVELPANGPVCAGANSSHSHPYVSLAVERGVAAGAVITAVVAADIIWMIVCFQRKRTFDCSRSGSALGPCSLHNGRSSHDKITGG